MLDDDLHEETLPSSADGSLHPYRFDWSPKLTFPLYKATTRQWFDHLRATDEIYLNTLYNLADEEKHGRGVGDRNEGSRKLIYSGGRACKDPVMWEGNAVNTWVFCCASKIDKQLIDTWKAEVVYEINSIGFFRSITHRFRHISEFCIVSPVKYGDWLDNGHGTRQVDDWIDTHNPPNSAPFTLDFPSIAYMKDHDFAYQREIRATWEPPFERSQQRFEERLGRESEAERHRWDTDRVGILQERGGEA